MRHLPLFLSRHTEIAKVEQYSTVSEPKEIQDDKDVHGGTVEETPQYMEKSTIVPFNDPDTEEISSTDDEQELTKAESDWICVNSDEEVKAKAVAPTDLKEYESGYGSSDMSDTLSVTSDGTKRILYILTA